MQYRTGTILVVLQFLGIGIASIGVAQSATPQRLFLPVVILGIIIGLITLRYNRLGNFAIHPEPLEHGRLITEGPYAWVRHPMYLSVIVFLLGTALYAGHLLGWIGLAVATGAMYGKTVIEERLLTQRYAEYEDYRSRTHRLIPFIF